MTAESNTDERAALAKKQDEFIDAILAKGRIKNDAELSRLLEMAPPVISKLRHGRMPVGATVLIAINEVTDIPVREMKAMLGYKVLESRARA